MRQKESEALAHRFFSGIGFGTQILVAPLLSVLLAFFPRSEIAASNDAGQRDNEGVFDERRAVVVGDQVRKLENDSITRRLCEQARNGSLGLQVGWVSA